jgi:hypothetical protein
VGEGIEEYKGSKAIKGKGRGEEYTPNQEVLNPMLQVNTNTIT